MVAEILSAQFLSNDLIDDFGSIYKDKYSNFGSSKFELQKDLVSLNSNITDFSLIYLERMCEPTGLWPSAGFSALLYMQRKISISLPFFTNKWGPTQTLAPEVSADYKRIGHWAGDHEKAQLNCIRGKVLPDVYYSDADDIVDHYRKMFLLHSKE